MVQDEKKKLDKEKVSKLISLNPDAKAYFFTRASINEFDWLWQNGFLDVIKQKSEDPTRYGYRTPELNYLVRVAPDDPRKVVDFMLTVPISADNFNPEVVDRFVWICQNLPADQLARIVPKILKDGWVPLMGKFNRWGFEYKKMFETLTVAKDYDSILLLAETVLTVRTKDEVTKTGRGVWVDNPLYFPNNDLGQINAFTPLVSVDDAHLEGALSVATKVLGKIVSLGDESRDGSFALYDSYHLLDINVFELELGVGNHLSFRDDLEDLVATVKKLLERSIGTKCADAAESKRLHEQYVKTLPDSRLMWRLRLFVWTLCPAVFKKELCTAFFKIFDTKDLWDFIGGAEYKEALRRGFSIILPEGDKRLYVSRIISLFGGEDKEPHEKGSGRDILSSILPSLTSEEKARAKAAFGQDLDPNYAPRASIESGNAFAGAIQPKSPVDQETLSRKTVSEIAESLKIEWGPEELKKSDTKQDFFHPLNAEGMGDELKANLTNRLGEYLSNAVIFFDRDRLDPHYTYSFLSGINNLLRLKTYPKDVPWDELVKLFAAITDSGSTTMFDDHPRDRKETGAWLAGWSAVHAAMGDLLQELLKGDEKQPLINFSENRNTLLRVIAYLLHHPDPTVVAEKESTTDGETYSGSDPFTVAINSVRGRAFQAFTIFVWRDGLGLPKDSTLASDIKEVYERLLVEESTMSIRFLFGHYLPTFYYRERTWMRGKFSEIFPTEEHKKDLYLAAWEGYLAANLYKELFEDLVLYYKRAIALDTSQYTPRKYFKDIDESLAAHIALALVHFDNFDLDSDLFKIFWETKNGKRHESFISFMGRHCVSRDNANGWLRDNKVTLDKIQQFWDWALTNVSDPAALEGFGFWINTEREVFDPTWLATQTLKTLQRTNGKIDWDYGLMQSLSTFASHAPQDTLSILEIYLSNPETLSGQRTWIYVDEKLIEIFKTLYAHPETTVGTRNLINKLLPIGGGTFWKLKDVLR